uniref:Carbohydrate sulfotransferase n=1 Tax=Strongyloides venezuelensis TaxID=75913 RepID=A0A0K0F668_STRVS
MGKNFSSMIVAIFCYLYDEKKFLSIHRHLNEDYFNNHACKNENQGSTFKGLIKRFGNGRKKNFLRKWKHFIIIRHPIERFISGFTHICVHGKNYSLSKKTCFNCNENVECFITKLYDEIFLILNGRKKFAEYHLRHHFFPQSWHCQYITYKKYYKVLKYTNDNLEKFYDELMVLLKGQNIPEDKLKFISYELKNNKSIHKTQGSNEQLIVSRNLYSNTSLIDLLTRIYYEDFINFHFSLPDIL